MLVHAAHLLRTRLFSGGHKQCKHGSTYRRETTCAFTRRVLPFYNEVAQLALQPFTVVAALGPTRVGLEHSRALSGIHRCACRICRTYMACLHVFMKILGQQTPVEAGE